MSYMKTIFAALLVCVAVQAQAQSWSTFGTGKWTGANQVTTTSDSTAPATYGGVSLTGGPTTLDAITALSFSYTPNTNGASGGSPRLVLQFSDGGTAQLRPLTWTAETSTTVEGFTGNNWDNDGGTCGYRYAATWDAIKACYAGVTITEIFIVNDSGWIVGTNAAEQVILSAVNVNGIPFHPSKNDCKNGGFRDLGFANQGACVSTFVQ